MPASPRIITQENESFAKNALALENWRDRFAGYPTNTITGFYEFTDEAVTFTNISGLDRISNVDDYRTGFGIDALWTVDAQKPYWRPTDGPGGRGCAQFDVVGSDNDKLLLPAAYSIPTGNFFSAALFFSPIGNTQTLVGNTDMGTGIKHGLRLLSTGHVAHTVGENGGVQLNPEVPFLANTWSLAVGSWNHSDKTARVRRFHPGSDASDSETNAATPLNTTSNQYIGDAGQSLRIALVVIGETALLDQDGYYQDKLLRDLVGYCDDRFRLKF